MKITKDISRLILHDSHFVNELREGNNLVVNFDWAKLENQRAQVCDLCRIYKVIKRITDIVFPQSEIFTDRHNSPPRGLQNKRHKDRNLRQRLRALRPAGESLKALAYIGYFTQTAAFASFGYTTNARSNRVFCFRELRIFKSYRAF